MNKLAQFKISVLEMNGPRTWSSLSIIRPQLLSTIKTLYPKIKMIDVGTVKTLPVADNLWLLPLGEMHLPFVHWLKLNFPNPYKRPRMMFFLNGEGTKLCYHLHTLKDFFRVDDEWVVSSEREKQVIDALIPNNNRTHILHYPVDRAFRPSTKSREKLRKQFELPSKSPVLLYAGRISAQKNVTQLLDVLEKFPRLFLAVCGDVDSLGLPHFTLEPDNNIASELTQEIARRNLSARIKFYGHLSQTDLKDMMKASDYQISLSTHYGEEFGYSIAQGLVSGLKTILTDWGGHGNWKIFFSPKEITYLSTIWEDGKGSANLDDLMALPSRSKKDFLKEYESSFKKNLKGIIENTTFNDRKVSLEIRKDLVDHLKGTSKTLYKGPEDSLFKEVIKIYSGT